MTALNSVAKRPAREQTPYRIFPRSEWARRRADTPMTLTQEDVARLSGINEQLSVEEVIDIYLPLSRLLNLYVGASQKLHAETSGFLHKRGNKTPFIIGMAGSVAVGKSTTARVLRELLARWPNHPRVDLVPTDGFLLPNAELIARGIMDRKGFPESYDQKELLKFLGDVKAGRAKVRAPVYSHFDYDILPGKHIVVDRPDVLIVEGLNVLQTATLPRDGKTLPFVSDFFDFSIYMHAEPAIIEQWYVERFITLCKTAFSDPKAYFHRYSQLNDEQARETALSIWHSINQRNLEENILPTRQRADLILNKGTQHLVETVWLRKL
ncbi:MAG: type I pantothenate kinase [Alphaproteobacteria bacterium]